MKYEVVREIYNKCSGNQMRDVYVDEMELESPKAYIEEFVAGKDVTIEEGKYKDGTVFYDVYIAGLKQRFSFSEI